MLKRYLTSAGGQGMTAGRALLLCAFLMSFCLGALAETYNGQPLIRLFYKDSSAAGAAYYQGLKSRCTYGGETSGQSNYDGYTFWSGFHLKCDGASDYSWYFFYYSTGACVAPKVDDGTGKCVSPCNPGDVTTAGIYSGYWRICEAENVMCTSGSPAFDSNTIFSDGKCQFRFTSNDGCFSKAPYPSPVYCNITGVKNGELANGNENPTPGSGPAVTTTTSGGTTTTGGGNTTTTSGSGSSGGSSGGSTGGETGGTTTTIDGSGTTTTAGGTGSVPGNEPSSSKINEEGVPGYADTMFGSPRLDTDEYERLRVGQLNNTQVSSLPFLWSFSVPQGACRPITMGIHGYEKSVDLCSHFAVIRSLMSYVWGFLAMLYIIKALNRKGA